jgi:adenylyltransferase/sulfurtransferase
MIADFSEEQIRRYARHIVLPEVGGKGQRKLLNSSVLCIGAGGLGSPAIQYLAAAGIGKLGVVDSDVVELSNLQRQTIHGGNVGMSKAVSAKEFVRRLNEDVDVVIYEIRLTAENVREIIRDYDFVIDGSDNFPTRYLVNDACVLENKPFSHGSIFRFEGYVTTIVPKKGPCYRCLFEHAPPPGSVPSCQEAGVFGVLPGIIGSIQTAECIKYLLGKGELLVGRMVCLDALRMTFEEIKIRRNEECPICGQNPKIKDIVAENYEETCEIRW